MSSTFATATASGSATVIGPTVRIEGSIISPNDVFVSGEVQGTIQSEARVTIAAGATANATVKAKEVVVAGSVTGNVDAQSRLQLCAGANLVGDVKTAGIVIEDGAYFKGGIDITRPASSTGAAA